LKQNYILKILSNEQKLELKKQFSILKDEIKKEIVKIINPEIIANSIKRNSVRKIKASIESPLFPKWELEQIALKLKKQ